MRRFLGVPLVAVLVVGCSGAESDLEDAAAVCEEQVRTQVNTGDDGRSISVRSSEHTPEVTTEISACLLRELQVPDSTMSKIEGTTAMMGRQSDAWGAFEASWTYHPDEGLELIIEVAE